MVVDIRLYYFTYRHMDTPYFSGINSKKRMGCAAALTVKQSCIILENKRALYFYLIVHFSIPVRFPIFKTSLISRAICIKT